MKKNRDRVRPSGDSYREWPKMDESKQYNNKDYDSWLDFSPEVWYFLTFASFCFLIALCLGKHKGYRNSQERAIMRSRRINRAVQLNQFSYVQPPMME